MPAYDFRCDQCGAIEEVTFSIKDYQSELDCVADVFCGGRMHRVLHSPNTMVIGGRPKIDKRLWPKDE